MIKLAIVAPSSPFNKKLLLDGINKLKSLGLNAVYNERIFKRGWDDLTYFVGTPEDRAQEIMEYFEDKSIKAIIAARGGYGSNLVADYLDYSIIEHNPKIIMGFSDLTFLLNAIFEKAQIPTFHGPMIGTYRFLSMNKPDFDIFLKLLKDPNSLIEISYNSNNLINSAICEGELIGGNLTLLATMTGTNYDFNADGKIIFLEDTNEAGYKIDRMLTHLKQAGKFDNAKGILFGEMLACGITEDILSSIIDHLDIKIPVLFDFPAGHGERNVVVPIGGKCKIDPKSNKIKYSLNGV